MRDFVSHQNVFILFGLLMNPLKVEETLHKPMSTILPSTLLWGCCA